jgi:hypothetical protein
MNLKTFSDFLLGRYSQAIKQGCYERCREFASLRDLDPDDLHQALEALLIAGKMRKRRGGLVYNGPMI